MRRYTPLKPSSGTRWPPEVARAIRERDGGCVGFRAGFGAFMPPTNHHVGLEIDHVRASGALGKKSASVASNGAVLCQECHRFKTENGRLCRPLLLHYLERFP